MRSDISVRAAWVPLAAFVLATPACSPPWIGDQRDAEQRSSRQAPAPGDDKPATTQSADAGSRGEAACAALLPQQKCGLDPQCGCLDTETCDVSDRVTGATSCVTAGGGTLGRSCRMTQDCSPGLACVYGACRPYCATPQASCTVAGTQLCVSVDDEDGKPIPNLNVCTIRCDPREPSGVCGANNACHWFVSRYAPGKVSDCNAAGAKGALEPCSGDAECKAGLACVGHPRVGKECERWCRLDVPGDCGSDPDFSCKDVYGENAPIIDGHREGLCQD